MDARGYLPSNLMRYVEYLIAGKTISSRERISQLFGELKLGFNLCTEMVGEVVVIGSIVVECSLMQWGGVS
jgi:hypothetical protein